MCWYINVINSAETLSGEKQAYDLRYSWESHVQGKLAYHCTTLLTSKFYNVSDQCSQHPEPFLLGECN